MTAIMSTSSSPATSPPVTSPSTNPNHPVLPPLITSPPARRNTAPHPMSHASKNRLSQYSAGSIPSRSRPPSQLFPIFHSSLTYTIVRDFAYPPQHPMHYGPPPESSRPPSGMTTPSSESRRLSDPPTSWETRLGWDWTSDGGLGRGGDLAPMHFGDGPPWSEDEDLQSPVVSSRHKKHKSTGSAMGHRGRSRDERSGQITSSLLNPQNYDGERGYFVSTTGDGSQRYYVNQGEEANGPGGEYVTYPSTQAQQPSPATYPEVEQRPRQYAENDADYPSESEASSNVSSPGFAGAFDQSRYSRDYQFTITSPDEEMHGKAVALFDFERENENELPLQEGQIIWVSYRHGEGWLVAQDPKTQESGLVPEEYVRLLRDIEGGMNSLTGQTGDRPGTPNDVGTPTQAEHSGHCGHAPTQSNSSESTNGYHQPVVSTFSTSSKDLDPYPQHLLGSEAKAPPQVIHYHGQRGGSQANTPIQHSFEGLLGRRGSHDVIRRGSQDLVRRGSHDGTARRESISGRLQGLETLPDKRLQSPAEESELQQHEGEEAKTTQGGELPKPQGEESEVHHQGDEEITKPEGEETEARGEESKPQGEESGPKGEESKPPGEDEEKEATKR